MTACVSAHMHMNARWWVAMPPPLPSHQHLEHTSESIAVCNFTLVAERGPHLPDEHHRLRHAPLTVYRCKRSCVDAGSLCHFPHLA